MLCFDCGQSMEDTMGKKMSNSLALLCLLSVMGRFRL